MTLPTSDSLRDLSRDELMALAMRLAERLERLEAEFEQLKWPPTGSRNSSQPPSRDQKSDRPRPKRRRAHPWSLSFVRDEMIDTARWSHGDPHERTDLFQWHSVQE